MDEEIFDDFEYETWLYEQEYREDLRSIEYEYERDDYNNSFDDEIF